MKQAEGRQVHKYDCRTREEMVSPELQRSLSNLNVLDVICHEKDHRLDNYNVVFNNNKAAGVVAFDNDSPMSLGIGGISFLTYMNCSPWSIKGKLNRPYIDRTVADKIKSIDVKKLSNDLSDILNSLQLLFLRCRIKQIKRVLSELPESVIVDDNAWCEDTVKEELSGTYGETYLSLFVK